MKQIARVVPVKSREALELLCNEIRAKSDEEKKPFFDTFGTGHERWYYQEIAGEPHLISVTEASELSAGHARYENSNDPFFVWFRDRVEELSGVDLRKTPTGATSELMLEMSNQPHSTMPQEAAHTMRQR